MSRREPDRIHVRDLRVRATVGATRKERAEKQELILNLALETDLSAAARTDSLEHSIDYSRLKKRILAALRRGPFPNMARVAEVIAGLCLEDPKASCVHVRLEWDPGMMPTRRAAVSIVRGQGQTPDRS